MAGSGLVEANRRKFEGCLEKFLLLIDSQETDKAEIVAHLRFPSASGTLAGSALGRKLWDSQEGVALVSSLLDDPILRKWFAPPPESRLNEIHFRVGSLVDRWFKEGSDRAVIRRLANQLLDTLLEPVVTATGKKVFFGITLDSTISLPYNYQIEPATQEELGALLSMSGGRKVDALRIPSEPAIVVTTRVAVPREQWRAVAGTTAIAFPAAMLESMRFVLWLSTGVFCGNGDYYVTEESAFPIADLERQAASVQEVFSRGLDDRVGKLDESVIRDIMVRHEGGVHGAAGVELSEEALRPLWTALTFLDAALRSADTHFVLFFCYSALEGMLLLEKDNESRLGPRVARLIGGNDDERREVRRMIGVWREMRGSAAHGNRPYIEHMNRFVSIGSTTRNELDVESEVDVRRIEEAARRRALEISRRSYLAMLYLLVRVEADAPLAGMTRNAALKVLELALRNETSAAQELETMIPPTVKSIEI